MPRGFGPHLLIGLSAIVFAECGLLIGFFLPGDSLLFTAGLLDASGAIGTPPWLLCTLLAAAAYLGNLCGYWIGRTAGPTIFTRDDSRFFRPEYVDKDPHISSTSTGLEPWCWARFVPIVRTSVTVTVTVGVARINPAATWPTPWPVRSPGQQG